MALLNFDASQVQPDDGQLDPIPTDWYHLMVDESEIKPTKENNGDFYLKVRISVVDGKYAGRKIFEQFNIKNKSAQAQEIAYRQLSALAHAVGVLNVQDSQQLHGIVFKGRVKLIPAVYEADGITVKYPPKNEMAAYKNVNDQNGTVNANGNGATAPQGNPFANAGMPPVQQAIPQQPAFMQQPVQPAPTQQFTQAQQPWQQPQQPNPAAFQAVPQAAQQPVTTQQQVQQPAPVTNQQQPAAPQWAQQPAPTPTQQAPAPVQQQPAGPAVDPNAVQEVQSNIPPWMRQPA